MEQKFEIRKTWRPNEHHKAPAPPPGFVPIQVPSVPPTRFFDQVSYIGDEFVGCYVIETAEGIILLDCLYPGEKFVNLIEDGLHELGLDAKNIKAIFITHGHFDHYGQADYFREKYGARVYMSKVDYEYYRNPPVPGLPPMPFEIYDFIADGDSFTLGSTTIRFFSTPGHSPGCMSFVFNVTDDERPHLACMWGGTGVPKDREAQETYLKSAEYFTEVCDRLGTDVEIANHPVIDCGVLKLQICREITNGVANPFVIGREACHRYTHMFYEFCKSKMK